jgi:hypothetical protein
VLPAALLLAACGGGGQGGPPLLSSEGPVATTPATPALPRPGFGGVVEVTFLTDDATTQDDLASPCALLGGRRAGLPASPLPPTVRWYDAPDDVEAAIDGMQRYDAVRRVLRPL